MDYVMEILNIEQILNNEVLEIRGDGKAGSGLVLVLQSLAGLLMRDETLHVQEWPFFSSARKGAAVRSFLRVSKKPITIGCEITNPHISILMDEGASKFVDFAAGVSEGGTFIVNTTHSPKEAAQHYKLSGRVICVSGDKIGEKYLNKPMGNISVFAILVKAIGLNVNEAKDALLDNLNKRRLPKNIIEANIKIFDESLNESQEGIFDYKGKHDIPSFACYGTLTAGAQSPLRISRANKTSSYARSGARVTFSDEYKKCTGCSLCISNCPENIINYVPDTKKGVQVTGADFGGYCKFCRECIEICPMDLFKEQPYEEKWDIEEVNQ